VSTNSKSRRFTAANAWRIERASIARRSREWRGSRAAAAANQRASAGKRTTIRSSRVRCRLVAGAIGIRTPCTGSGIVSCDIARAVSRKSGFGRTPPRLPRVLLSRELERLAERPGKLALRTSGDSLPGPRPCFRIHGEAALSIGPNAQYRQCRNHAKGAEPAARSSSASAARPTDRAVPMPSSPTRRSRRECAKGDDPMSRPGRRGSARQSLRQSRSPGPA
jgi:hypothetical protein